MNKSLDRDYFKKKANPRAKKGPQLTKCCEQDVDRDILNEKNKDDRELIEDHCEDNLRVYSSVESITPICCKVCGRLVKYMSKLSEQSYKKDYQ
tara:strand:- start:161 stop:442 length:282 start_codon:yes stop_codon:yes gene_type:complete